MSSTSTEHAELVVETVLSFLRGQFAVFSQLVGKRVRDGFGLVVLVIVAAAGGTFGLILVVAGFVGIIGLRLFVGFVGIVGIAGIVMVGSVGTGAGPFADSFPVLSVNRMGQDSHLVKCVRFTLLTHDVFDMIMLGNVNCR